MGVFVGMDKFVYVLKSTGASLLVPFIASASANSHQEIGQQYASEMKIPVWLSIKLVTGCDLNKSGTQLFGFVFAIYGINSIDTTHVHYTMEFEH